MLKNGRSVQANIPAGQNESPSNEGSFAQKLLGLIERISRRFLIITGPVLILIVLLLQYFQYSLSSEDLADDKYWRIFLGFSQNVMASLLAVWVVGIFASLLLFSEVAEKKRKYEVEQYIEKTVESVAKNIPPPAVKVDAKPFNNAIRALFFEVQRWGRLATCKFSGICPPELKKLQNAFTIGQDNGLEGVSSIALPLLRARLDILADQIKELPNGKWRLHFYEDNDDKNIQTETDLFYTLVTDHIFKSLKDISLQASTVIHYSDWWLTLPGLSYLEAERNRQGVERLFLFPVGTIGSVFEDYVSESEIIKRAMDVEKSNGWDGKSVFDEEYPNLYKEQVLVVLLLNYNITKNINLLTPAFCGDDSLKRHANEWVTKDQVIFQREDPSGVPTALCCAEVTSFKGSHDILRAAESYLYFSPKDVEHRVKTWSELINVSDTHRLRLSSIVEESEGLSALNKDVKSIVGKSALPKARNQLVDLWKKMKKGNNNG